MKKIPNFTKLQKFNHCYPHSNKEKFCTQLTTTHHPLEQNLQNRLVAGILNLLRDGEKIKVPYTLVASIVKKWSATMLVAWRRWMHLKTSSFKGLATHFRAIIHLVTNCRKSCQSLQECLVLPKPQVFAETQRSVVVHEGSKEWKITGRIFPGINLLAYSQRMQQHIQRMD